MQLSDEAPGVDREAAIPTYSTMQQHTSSSAMRPADELQGLALLKTAPRPNVVTTEITADTEGQSLDDHKQFHDPPFCQSTSGKRELALRPIDGNV